MSYSHVSELLHDWKEDVNDTLNVFRAVTDESLSQSVADGHRTIGRIMWHVVTTIPEMMSKTGLTLTAVDEHAPAPATAAEIVEGFEAAANEFTEAVASNWTDETLAVEDEMYGERWTRGHTSKCLVQHQIHHRGQLTVLMRQAGLRVPGVYGPTKDDWSKMDMEPPAI